MKVEYQAARSLFVRVVGEYTSHWQDSLRDDSRTNDPILIRDPNRPLRARAAGLSNQSLQVDWLVSYTPSPGTVVYAGYGTSLAEADAFAFRSVRRLGDGLFVKVSYLIRM